MSFSRTLTVTDLTSGEDRFTRRRRPRSSDSALRLKEKRAEWAKKEKVAAFFGAEDHKRLTTALLRLQRAGDGGAASAYAILDRRVPTKRSGFVAVAPDAAQAATLATYLRKRGVDGFCQALARLDEIAGAPAPAGRPIELCGFEFEAVLATLDAAADAGNATAARAAAHLRTATVKSTLIRIHATAADAGWLADALHAAGAGRLLVHDVDVIAGRAGFREPLAAPAA
ncbi:hypothetical protein [Methylorubrum salsuginis]|uniref:Uncharacterized protein n=1 Tax=Methylorubrum salsuginis TaxID=414703 RepID=A0A1I4FII9_9HYPH|nr:hypothetical protein [Methylorubrum salsuginis]SFL17765.1 hypothetical protein SAMN04488125_11062 [Methylorubrum salsuginis]